MSQLLLVRHAQASFLDGDYDRLSELGRRQSRTLGQRWAALGQGFDRFVAGPRTRQRDTALECRGVLVAHGVAVPELEVLDGLDEYPAEEILRGLAPERAGGRRACAPVRRVLRGPGPNATRLETTMTRPASTLPTAIPPDERRSGMARPTHDASPAGPRPSWLKVRLSMNEDFFALRELVHREGLHTVCESAACPNIGECWSKRALTFMILGNVCTRSCGFCDVETGKPGGVDWDEPRRVAEMLGGLGLRYAVITSVDRDDLPDGGALIWAQTIKRVREACPEMELEVLVPDFKGDLDAVATVVRAQPTVYAHNLETVARLHREVRPQAKYERSLQTL